MEAADDKIENKLERLEYIQVLIEYKYDYHEIISA